MLPITNRSWLKDPFWHAVSQSCWLPRVMSNHRPKTLLWICRTWLQQPGHAWVTLNPESWKSFTKYGDIFAMKSSDFEWTDRVYHHIDPGQVRLIRQPQRRHPLAKQVDVDKMLENMQWHGVIEESAPGHPLSSSGRWMGTYISAWTTGNWTMSQVCNSLQQGISIGPISFCILDCSQRCLSIVGTVWPLLPQEGAYILVVQLFPTQSFWIPASCSNLYLLDIGPHLDFVADHSSWHGHCERASELLCFQPWQCSEVKLYSCRCWIQWAVCPSKLLNLMSQVNAEWSVCSGNLFHRGTYGNVLASSRWPVVPTGWCSNFSRPCSGFYCSRLLLAPVRRVRGTALLKSWHYSRVNDEPLLAAGMQE
jgi:hypothetical protein